MEEYKIILELLGVTVAGGALVYKLGMIHAGIIELKARLEVHMKKSDHDVDELKKDSREQAVQLAVHSRELQFFRQKVS